MAESPDSPGKIRIDKWLWFARVVKTRTLAKKLVLAGKVRLNGNRTRSPSIDIKPADVLTITLERRIIVYQIIEVGKRRGPASVACLLYEDLSPPVIKAIPLDKPARPAAREEGSGRPTKRDRRKLSRFRSEAGEEF
jgi:ribosome-associated heat shock protein Hsp15